MINYRFYIVFNNKFSCYLILGKAIFIITYLSEALRDLLILYAGSPGDGEEVHRSKRPFQ